ncbi:MAG: L,D-transpeptidase [Microthrixaceae bacterium]|nr:L,D-transpeptidase [Acidimicrobiales bacterium]MCB9404725.1 L,D-transpeptidase [Microthrixaceae bacterium]
MQRPSARLLPLIGAVLVLLVGGVIFFLDRDSDPKPVAAPVTTTAPRRTTTTAKPTPEGFMVADAAGPIVDLYSSPGVAYAEKPWLDNPTHEGLAVVFEVLEDGPEYLKVRVSSRPNGLEAYVKKDQVSVRYVPNRIQVEVGARRVTVFKGDTDEVLLQETVAVGRDRTPTPLGHFFVDGIVTLANDKGSYGSHQVSVSGFSEKLQSFQGGSGQIALHGTNRPDLLGQPISNGCVRMTNDAISRVAFLAPTGTPVEIVA